MQVSLNFVRFKNEFHDSNGNYFLKKFTIVKLLIPISLGLSYRNFIL